MSRLELRQNLTQKLSPQQIQFMKLLQVSNSSIESEIKKELEENPALEEIENNEKEALDDLNQFDYKSSQKISKDSFDYSKESNISNKESFRENLSNQLNYIELDSNEKIIANQIIGSLENDGYLRRELESVIDDIAFTENIEFKLDEVKNVLLKIQKLEPAGIASRNLEECLTIQIDSVEDPSDVQIIAKEILVNSFDDFKRKQFEKIYEKFKSPKEKVKEAFNYIKTLNPIPSGGMEDSTTTEFLMPDFIIKKDDNEFVVEFTSDTKQINVNKTYISMFDELSKKKDKDSDSKESYNFIKNKIQSAKWFIEALNQRNNTLNKTMKAIIEYQKKFFQDGEENDLRPMILKDIAEIIKMDVSTVSRIVSSKVVQTDFGVFPLKYFFSESTIKKGKKYVSSKVVKNFLKDIIDNENKERPLSDELLEKKLKEEGFEVARRTVAKYREQLNIPVARLRKEY
ncbi:MAG: RNA polymerase sigma-54 factor [Flammeovirgaceae bacterium]|jgi:RNA polymerase sigma-54 factor|nr:RNA polymerase sigma-54 factor [Flammeovirgaceae bacterium]